jgi:hypothetical protein
MAEMEEIRSKLNKLLVLLRNENKPKLAAEIEEALLGTDEDVKAYVTSNELWGGSGSVADQALGAPRRELRRELEI